MKALSLLPLLVLLFTQPARGLSCPYPRTVSFFVVDLVAVVEVVTVLEASGSLLKGIANGVSLDDLLTSRYNQRFLARLKVIHPLKGAASEYLDVHIEDFSCCALPAFVPGERMLVFLDYSERNFKHLELWPYWSPAAYPGGTYPIASGDEETWIQVVRDGLKVAGQHDRKSREWQEWAIRAANEPATRRLGVDQLRPPHLGAEDFERLADAFVEDPTVDRGGEELLRVLAQHPDNRLDQVAVDIALAWSATDWFEWTETWFALAKERLGLDDRGELSTDQWQIRATDPGRFADAVQREVDRADRWEKAFADFSD